MPDKTNHKIILVIDDDKMVHKLLQHILTKEGYDVVTLIQPADAVKSIGEHTPDLILLDVSMPDISGFEVLKALNEQNIHIPTVLLSATSQQHNIDYGFELGIRGFIPKPFSKTALIKKIREILTDNSK